MLTRPRDLADKLAPTAEVFRLPLDSARRKAREIINQASSDGYRSVIENWRQLSDGQIEFVIRQYADAGRK